MRTTVLGGGAWGTALAAHSARAGLPVRTWIREPEVAAAVNERRENHVYLPGVELPAGLRATPRLDEALGDAETVLVVVPSEFCRAVYRQAAGLAPEGAIPLPVNQFVLNRKDGKEYRLWKCNPCRNDSRVNLQRLGRDGQRNRQFNELVRWPPARLPSVESHGTG